MDFEAVARDLLRALRGRRSQVAWSRRLGYRSNVAYCWEAGRRWPTAAETLRACGRTRIDVTEALTQFYGRRPAWLAQTAPDTTQGVAYLLDDLRGSTAIVDLARRAGRSRYAVSRWLSGQTQPRLPDFLRVVEAASLRLVDLLAALVPPEQIGSIAAVWRRLEARRRGAFDLPWTQAVLRALELAAYGALETHAPGWIASQVGISPEEEARCLAFLEETDHIAWNGTHYVIEAFTVDTRAQPEVGQKLKAHWSRVGSDRAQSGAAGQFSYNVFTVSQRDFERIRAAHLRYFRELRGIVAESEPGEVVAVANVQLFPLGAE